MCANGFFSHFLPSSFAPKLLFKPENETFDI